MCRSRSRKADRPQRLKNAPESRSQWSVLRESYWNSTSRKKCASFLKAILIGKCEHLGVHKRKNGRRGIKWWRRGIKYSCSWLRNIGVALMRSEKTNQRKCHENGSKLWRRSKWLRQRFALVHFTSTIRWRFVCKRDISTKQSLRHQPSGSWCCSSLKKCPSVATFPKLYLLWSRDQSDVQWNSS